MELREFQGESHSGEQSQHILEPRKWHSLIEGMKQMPTLWACQQKPWEIGSSSDNLALSHIQ